MLWSRLCLNDVLHIPGHLNTLFPLVMLFGKASEEVITGGGLEVSRPAAIPSVLVLFPCERSEM